MHDVREQPQDGFSTIAVGLPAHLSGAVIPLSRGLCTVVDTDDAEYLGQWQWIALRAKPGRFYAGRFAKVDGRRIFILMHREILQAPSGLHVDHRDNDSLNNRRSNLRLGTRCQNAQNSPAKRTNSTGFKGVSRQGHRYVAQICANRMPRVLGTFDTPEEAHAAYCRAAAELHGEFARLE